MTPMLSQCQPAEKQVTLAIAYNLQVIAENCFRFVHMEIFAIVARIALLL